MKEQNYLDQLVGVFGHPVAENPGVVIQQAAFEDMGLKNWRFLTIDVAPGMLEDAIRGLKAMNMRGVNCTLPHKVNVLKYLDSLSDCARLTGAVNTIVNDGGRLYGDNTDGKGFMASLREAGIAPEGTNVTVLGAGGASRAVCVELLLAGARHITVYNKIASETEALKRVLDALQGDVDYRPWDRPVRVPDGTDIFINATPVGLYPDVDAMPDIDVATILPHMFVQDVIPNPAMTALLKAAQARGARINTGMGMLVNQAAINIEMWTGRKPNKQVMLAALEEALG